MSSSLSAIDAQKLVKTFGNFNALDHLTLHVPEGSLFGLLGPNGAGKTTLLRTLLGYIRATSGSAEIFGQPIELDSKAIRSLIAYLPAEAKLFRMMRGTAVLRLFSDMHPRGDFDLAASIARRLNLDTSRMVGFMSTGMRQKLAISCVLGIRSRLIILDEPTANLDPTVRQEVMQLVKEAHAAGSTVVLSSHLLDEIEQLCSRAAIVKAGRVVHEVDIQSMKNTYRAVVQSTGTQSEHRDSNHRFNESQLDLPRGMEWKPAMSGDPIGSDLRTLHISTADIALDEAFGYLKTSNLSLQHIEPLGLRTIYETCSAS